MKSGHILLILLVLVALASHAYVALEWDYRDAPEDVRLALGLGFLVAGILALLLGPRMLGKRSRGAPIILPALLALVLLGIVGSVAGASSTYSERRQFVVQPGETIEYPVGGTGAIYKVDWCVQADGMSVTRATMTVEWLGESYASKAWQVDRCSPTLTWWVPGGARLEMSADAGLGPARFQVRIERYEGVAIPVRLVLPPGFSSTIDLVPSTSTTSKGLEIEGRHWAVAFIKADRDATGTSTVRLVGNEKGDWANLKQDGSWLHAQGDRIQLKLRNYSGNVLYVRGYILLEPLPPLDPPLDNTTSNASTTPGQEEQPDRSAEYPSSLSPGLLGAGALAGLLLALLAARRG